MVPTKSIRSAAVSGLFYPSDHTDLHETIDRYLEDVSQQPPPSATTMVKAIIAPHAGYIYSGQIAASAYKCLEKKSQSITRVVLFGPSHHVAFTGMALSTAACYQTPFGTVEIDTNLTRLAKNSPNVTCVNQAHLQEHSIEVQLPFLQHLLGSFTLLPIVVGQSAAIDIADVLESLWGGDETLIVVSSDLSHYLDYTQARKTDAATTKMIESLDYPALNDNAACGRVSIAGLLEVARRKNLRCRAIDVRNSGDTAGDRQRVVGYGAFHLYNK